MTLILVKWCVSVSPMNILPERERVVVPYRRHRRPDPTRPPHHLEQDDHSPAIATRKLVLRTMLPMEERIPPPPPRPHYLWNHFRLRRRHRRRRHRRQITATTTIRPKNRIRFFLIRHRCGTGRWSYS